MRHPTYEVILTHLKETSKKKNGLVMVDAGCGNGLLLSLLPRQLVGKYLGIDISRAAIEKGKERYKKRPNVIFKLGNCLKIPMRDSSVDVVISIGVLQYLSDQERNQFIKEAKRVLRPGGRLIVSCLVDHVPYVLMDLYGLFSAHGLVNREMTVKSLHQHGFVITSQREYGFFFSPFNSGVICLFADALDHFAFGTRGSIGPVGQRLRRVLAPLEYWEYGLQFDYGYTLVILAVKD